MTSAAQHSPSQAPARLSLWAMASVPIALFVCLPFAVTSIVLAVVGLVQIRRSGGRVRGRGYAAGALVLSAAAIVLQVIALLWWDTNVRRPMQAGPSDALVLGLSANVEGFRAAFAEPGRGTPDEAARFLEEVGQRYGQLRYMGPDEFAQTLSEPQSPSLPIIPYRIVFESGEVRARAMFVTFGPSDGLPNPVLRWAWIRIIDEERGDLVYPREPLSYAERSDPEAGS